MGSKNKKIDLTLLLLTIGISLFGILMVYNASVVEAFEIFADKYHFLKMQSLWVAVGLVGLAAASLISLPWLKKISPALLLINIILLILVLIPGISSKTLGARRWISLAGFNLQPTELIKLTLSIYLAAWLSKERSFWSYLVILITILGLIMLQPDLGTSIVIIVSAFLVYYASGASLLYILGLGVLGTLSGLGLILLSPYRKQRLLTFFNPTSDPLGSSYHIRQALIAVGSGGLWGLGLGQSRQKYQFLPQVTTDSIFAIIAEELGFLGAGLVIVALFVLILKAFKIAKYAPDKFSQLLATGIASWLGIQVIVNISAMLALLPLTGVPLPLISYGGSSTVVILMAVGLLLNISRYQINPKKLQK
ncbi:putative lipid II flippase FtsW [Patescibacteria group bacterium]